MYCKNCGKEISENAVMCPYCGEGYQTVTTSGKSKIVAGLLALFVGYLGIHNFYLGYNIRGIIQLLLTVVGWCFIVGPIISCVWAFVEMVLIFLGSIRDADGNQLQ